MNHAVAYKENGYDSIRDVQIHVRGGYQGSAKNPDLSLSDLPWQAKVKPGLLELIETDRSAGESRDRVMMFLGAVQADSRRSHEARGHQEAEGAPHHG
jgi:hypothetical protein